MGACRDSDRDLKAWALHPNHASVTYRASSGLPQILAVHASESSRTFAPTQPTSAGTRALELGLVPGTEVIKDRLSPARDS